MGSRPRHRQCPEGIHAELLAWFDAHARDLPWRRHRSPYGTWISEMMLQQTTVATVAPYWERFLARFPDVFALARAPEAEVLALWSGLGYYRRARQLHAAARRVADEAGGVLPGDIDGWRRLPGVGPYAAGAIASIGLGLREPAVDANVRRVLSRWRGAGEPTGAAASRELAETARALVPAERPGDWNEALMELGATVCLPRRPACGACPVARHCASAGAIPGASPGSRVISPPRRPTGLPVGVVIVVLTAGGRLWLEPSGGTALTCRGAPAAARDDFTGLHPGLLALPMSAWYPLPAGRADQEAALAGLAATLGLPAGLAGGGGEPIGRFRHAITRYRILAGVVIREWPSPAAAPGPPPGRPPGLWVDPVAAGALHLSQLARKALAIAGPARG